MMKPCTIWLTGLSGAGKSTLAGELDVLLKNKGVVCYALDGDGVRNGLNKDLGFSQKDRSENIRRVAEVARLMNDAGVTVIASFISPFQADRELAKNVIGADAYFEIYLSTSIQVCEARDPKQLYAKARAGALTNFTGISSPYEPPHAPHVTLDTGAMSQSDCIRQLADFLDRIP